MKPSANYVLLEGSNMEVTLSRYLCLLRPFACTPALRRSGLLFDLLGEEER